MRTFVTVQIYKRMKRPHFVRISSEIETSGHQPSFLLRLVVLTLSLFTTPVQSMAARRSPKLNPYLALCFQTIKAASATECGVLNLPSSFAVVALSILSSFLVNMSGYNPVVIMSSVTLAIWGQPTPYPEDKLREWRMG